jgi:hypothetical protein
MALSDELYHLYTAQIYPVLANNDPVYRRSLQKCGVGWNGGAVPAGQQNSFDQEMKMQAWLAAQRVADARSLEPGSIRAKLLTGPQILYRVSGSAADQANPGIWWFSEKVAQRSKDAAGSERQARLDWLRDVLAVCFNWSSFDHLVRFTLHPGEAIPAVFGKGLPMPYNKVTPFIDRKTGTQAVSIPADYWKNMGKSLLGGELQIVLPWIPVGRVARTPSL